MKLAMKLFVAVMVGVIVFGTAYAQFAKPEQAIKYRKAVMSLIVAHFGRMGAVVKGKAPYEEAEFARNALAVNTLSSILLVATESSAICKTLPLSVPSSMLLPARIREPCGL